MFSIILTIIGIALTTALAALWVNYSPITAAISLKSRTLAESGLKALHDGSVRYIKSVTDVDGIAHLPAPGTNLHLQLQPAFVFFPAAPTNMEWTVQSAMYGGYPAIAICLKPTGLLDPAAARGVISIKNQFSPTAIFSGEGCGITGNGQGTHITYWVIAQHHAAS